MKQQQYADGMGGGTYQFADMDTLMKLQKERHNAVKAEDKATFEIEQKAAIDELADEEKKAKKGKKKKGTGEKEKTSKEEEEAKIAERHPNMVNPKAKSKDVLDGFEKAV